MSHLSRVIDNALASAEDAKAYVSLSEYIAEAVESAGYSQVGNRG